MYFTGVQNAPGVVVIRGCLVHSYVPRVARVVCGEATAGPRNVCALTNIL